MDKTTRTSLDNLWSEDRELQNKAFTYVLKATEKPVDWSYDAWGELLANLKDIQLDLATFGHWDEPHASELIADAQRTIIFERIVLALRFLGYVSRTIGRPN